MPRIGLAMTRSMWSSVCADILAGDVQTSRRCWKGVRISGMPGKSSLDGNIASGSIDGVQRLEVEVLHHADHAAGQSPGLDVLAQRLGPAHLAHHGLVDQQFVPTSVSRRLEKSRPARSAVPMTGTKSSPIGEVRQPRRPSCTPSLLSACATLMARLPRRARLRLRDTQDVASLASSVRMVGSFRWCWRRAGSRPGGSPSGTRATCWRCSASAPPSAACRR